MKQNRKYWAKNDKILLADKSMQECEQTDSFKTCHIPKKKVEHATEKVGNLNHWKNNKGLKMKHDKA